MEATQATMRKGQLEGPLQGLRGDSQRMRCGRRYKTSTRLYLSQRQTPLSRPAERYQRKGHTCCARTIHDEPHSSLISQTRFHLAPPCLLEPKKEVASRETRCRCVGSGSGMPCPRPSRVYDLGNDLRVFWLLSFLDGTKIWRTRSSD